MKHLGPIYLIRHGETVWNRASRLQGHKDTPLTMKGVKQAQALGFALRGVLKNKTPGFFYASPIGRAKQTAAIISDIIDFDVCLLVLHVRTQAQTAQTQYIAWLNVKSSYVL